MQFFETTLSPTFSRLKQHLLNNTSADVYDVFRPLYYCCFIMGLTQFDVRTRRFRNHIWIILWNCAIVVASTISAFIALNSRVLTGKANAMYNIMDVALGWVSFANIDVIIIFGCIYKDRILKILVDLHTLDKELKRLNYIPKLPHKTMTLQVTTAMLLTTISILLVVTLEEKTYGNSTVDVIELADFVTYCVPLFSTSFMLLQFCAYLAIIKQRYKWLNQQIENIACLCKEQLLCRKSRNRLWNNKNHSTALSDEIFIESVVNAIQIVQKKHMRLTVVSQSLNVAYSVQILTTIIEIIFTFLAIMFFWAHKELRSDWGVEIVHTETYVYYSFGVLLLHAVQLIILVVFCSETVKEANKSGYIIHDIYYPSHSIDLQILQFSGQHVHREMKFTACNLFEINQALLCSLVAAIATYLVIVIQFEMIM